MIPLQDAHKKFVDHLKDKSRSKSTILAYGKDIQQLLDFLKDFGVSEVHHVKKDNIEKFMFKLTTDGYTSKSISRKTNSTKTFFRFLQINEYISDDPATLVSHPDYETKAPRILSKTEYRALRDAAKNDIRIYTVIELLLQTGVRIGELASLKIDDISFTNDNTPGEIRVTSAGKMNRTIPLNKSSEQAIKKYLEIRPSVKERIVFITKTGRPLLVRNIRTAIDRYFKIAGIKDAKVNDLRHTFVAHHLKAGASLVLISKLAGHKRISTTEKYLDYIQPDEESVDRVKLEEL
ncbi:MAG: tyrosine-type recombinase/integrase [bacterium]|nr:tyrosine-type recombinase/integrase [bacterium]